MEAVEEGPVFLKDLLDVFVREMACPDVPLDIDLSGGKRHYVGQKLLDTREVLELPVGLPEDVDALRLQFVQMVHISFTFSRVCH